MASHPTEPSHPAAAPIVAIINTNDDLVNVVREALVREGLLVVTGHIRDIKAGRLDFSVFLESQQPAVVIYDIAVPYEDNWTFFQTLRKLPAAQRQAFVVTTVNKAVFEKRVGSADILEIQGGRADDLEPVIEAVQAALGRRR